jgi:hypothetical protein
VRTPQQALADAIESGAVQAWIEGKEIELDCKTHWRTFAKDDPSDWPHFMGTEHRWRPAPTPKLRPWKPEEVPAHAWIRKNTPEGKEQSENIRCLIIAASDRGVTYFGTAARFADYAMLLSECEHSTDGGKTWKPCGVMEGES